jgi:hypothetical protein
VNTFPLFYYIEEAIEGEVEAVFEVFLNTYERLLLGFLSIDFD